MSAASWKGFRVAVLVMVLFTLRLLVLAGLDLSGTPPCLGVGLPGLSGTSPAFQVCCSLCLEV